MTLFKIKNRGLRFLAGTAVMSVVIVIVLSILWAIGYGAASLDKKFLNWDVEPLFTGSIFWMIVLGFLLASIIGVAGRLGFLLIEGSKNLGDQFFNDSVQSPK
mgnify:CR=1 FL=1